MEQGQLPGSSQDSPGGLALHVRLSWGSRSQRCESRPRNEEEMPQWCPLVSLGQGPWVGRAGA